MKEKYIIHTAKLFSMLFAPFYLPVLAFLILFIFSYMKLLPLNYKLVILGIVYVFTVALPLPKKDIASLLDTTPESLSRQLRRLQESGLIAQRGGRRVALRDLDALVDLSAQW